jgi:hypothetical protein
MAAQLEEETLKVGLLMEAAQSQQALATSALERLREHTAGLDAIVREEIRATILEEMHALAEDTGRAAEALRGLGRAASWRFGAWSTVVFAIAAFVPLGLAQWWQPSQAEVDTLAAQRDQLTANLRQLTDQGGRIEIRHCGRTQRLCVRVDRNAPSYGEAGDFRIVKGY